MHADLLDQALTAQSQGDLAAAFDLCSQVLDQQPANFSALHLMGVLALKARQPQDAVTFFEAALQLHTADAHTWMNLGSALHQLGRLDEALDSHDRALKEDPQSPQAWYNRAITLKSLGRLSDAAASYGRAVALKPDFQAAHYNHANTLHELGQYEEAIEHFNAAVDLDPQDGEARKNRAFALLMLGRYAQGWEDYEWRWSVPPLSQQRPDRGCPLWTGMQALAGRSILIHAEQGLGDTLQFCRYVGAVKALGAFVVLEVQPALLPLLGSLKGPDLLVSSAGHSLPPLDFHIPLLSLPRALGLVDPATDTTAPYLQACEARRTAWRSMLTRGSMKVGICWQGSNKGTEAGRSIPLQAFAPLSQIPGVRLFSLQRHVGLDQLQALAPGMGMTLFGPEFDAAEPFMDTAAVMMGLDLVITVDTSIAHLAGALGRPVWTALPMVPDWRWQHRGDRTPWYPSMRLFRQSERGDWAPVLAQIARELSQMSMGSGEFPATAVSCAMS